MKATRGWRVPPEGLDGEPILPGARKNSRHRITMGQARTLRRLYRLLDDGATRVAAALSLNAEGLTTLKGAPWSASAMYGYVADRKEFEAAVALVLGQGEHEGGEPETDHAKAVEREQAAIRRIRDLKKQGLTLRQITARINEEEHVTLAGNRWYVSTVERVLKGKPKASDRYAK